MVELQIAAGKCPLWKALFLCLALWIMRLYQVINTVLQFSFLVGQNGAERSGKQRRCCSRSYKAWSLCRSHWPKMISSTSLFIYIFIYYLWFTLALTCKLWVVQSILIVMCLITFLFRKVSEVIRGAADKVKIVSIILLIANCHFCFFVFFFPLYGVLKTNSGRLSLLYPSVTLSITVPRLLLHRTTKTSGELTLAGLFKRFQNLKLYYCCMPT